MDDVVTRGEFDLLKQMVGHADRRIDSIDQGGTRGVAVVQAQLTEVAKDVASQGVHLEARIRQLGERLDAHDERHNREGRQRVANRKWLVGSAIAFLAMLEGPLIYLISQHR